LEIKDSKLLGFLRAEGVNYWKTIFSNLLAASEIIEEKLLRAAYFTQQGTYKNYSKKLYFGMILNI